MLGPPDTAVLVLGVEGVVAGENKCLKGITCWEDMVFVNLRKESKVLCNAFSSISS